VFFASPGIAQSQADWWYFGNRAGLNFTTSGPVAVTNSVMKVIEGCASISDEFGNLLFYTQGDTVWDATHNVMPNGTGLLGNGIAGSGAQSAYIIPRPNSATEFYIFTIRSYYGGMHYTKVDMALNGGLGAVVNSEKNVLMVGFTPEMMTAARKPNNLDYWMVTFKKETDTIYAYEITSAGVNLNPVKSSTGITVDSTERFGYMRISQQSDRFAAVFIKYLLVGQTMYDKIHLFSFNNSTGEAAYDFGITPSVADTTNYGVEFSPDGSRLYVQSNFQSDLRQYNLNAGSLAAINASEVMVGAGYNASGGGALQLGPDGKIYIARNTATSLSVVSSPNALGGLCGFTYNGIALSGRLSIWGLPQFVPFVIQGNVSLSPACFGDSAHFSSNYINVDSVRWNFGDPASGTENLSSLVSPAHLYTDTGIFQITVIAYNGFLSDTNYLQIHILPRQQVDLGDDQVLCAGDSLVLNVGQQYSTYLWGDGSIASEAVVKEDSVVSVTVFGVCDTISDQIQVTFLQPFDVALGPDIFECDVQGVTIGDSFSIGYSVNWSSGATSDSIDVQTTGTYAVTVNNSCFSASDTIQVTMEASPMVDLPADTVTCFDQAIVLKRPGVVGVTYFWSDSSTKVTHTVDITKQVWLAAVNECGLSVDTMNIVFNGEIQSDLGIDTTICNQDILVLDAFSPGATYLWSTGHTTDTIVTGQKSAFYTVTVTYKDCQTIESKSVEMSDLFCPGIDCSVQTTNVFSPNGDGINDLWGITSDCGIYSYDLSIYNRWGQLVHFSNNSNFGWDGTINGEPASDGVYFYLLHSKDGVVVDVDQFDFKGSITLVR
jgi:gliding motility-associated-like protein